jgi:hypothetical protein
MFSVIATAIWTIAAITAPVSSMMTAVTMMSMTFVVRT